jgi:hypothetical protein
MNFVENKLPSVTKSYVDKSLKKLVKNVLEPTYLN